MTSNQGRLPESPLPKAAKQWAAEVTPLLAWPSLLVSAQVVGLSVIAALNVEAAEVARRAACQVPPAPNPALLAGWSGDTRFGERSPVQQVGFLVSARSWPEGRFAGGAVSAFAAVAVVLPKHPGEGALFDADLCGLGVVVTEPAGCRVLLRPAAFQTPAPTRMHRLVGEVLSQALIASQAWGWPAASADD